MAAGDGEIQSSGDGRSLGSLRVAPGGPLPAPTVSDPLPTTVADLLGRTYIDPTDGLLTLDTRILRTWAQLTTDAYLAFNTGHFDVASALYAMALDKYGLPARRHMEMLQAEEGITHPSFPPLRLISVSSEERLASLSQGAPDPYGQSSQDIELLGRAADLAEAATQYKERGEFEAAAGAYLAVEKLALMPPRILLDMAFVLGRLGELDASNARCRMLLHVPTFEYPEVRLLALEYLSMNLLKQDQRMESLQAALEALRLTVSSMAAINTLSTLEYISRGDEQMHILLELRNVAILRARGMEPTASARLARLQSRFPGGWPTDAPLRD